ncbi:MAG: glycoside hydrolase family 16 protein [Specibacter sp.]
MIETDQCPWSPEHNGGLRVSNLQTGVLSCPLGSTAGQHHFTPELRVRKAQKEQRLYTLLYGIVEARVATIADPACIVALWMIGFEDQPERSAEICIFEIFGNEMASDKATAGMGLHPFGDSGIQNDFVKIPVKMDATESDTYSVQCIPGRVQFFIDDEAVASMDQSPDYPI